MSIALKQLGYIDVFHAVDALDDLEIWASLERAADATFPSLPSYTGKGFSRSQWDELFGPCEAITDIAGPFALSLIAAYPEAKVILVTRDFDKWWKSVDETLVPMIWGPVSEVFSRCIEPLLGSRMIAAGRKMLLGWSRTKNLEEFRENSRMAFDRHEREIMGAVPQERLLYYRMGDGWEPLCRFLDAEAPDGKFPHANEQAAMKKKILDKQIRMIKEVGSRMVPYLGVGLVVGVGMLLLRI
jgi:hypothetical protein